MDRLFKLFAFLLSLLLYLLIILFFLNYFIKDKVHKIEIKAQSIDVYITEPTQKAKVVPQKIEPHKKPEAPKKKKSGSSSPKPKVLVSDLFSTVKTEKVKAKKESTPSQEVSKYRGHGGKKAKKLLEKLRLKEYQPSTKRMVKSVTGEKDPYLEKVYKLLYTYWMPSKLSAGNRAKVQIIIYTDGHITYKVLRYSSSDIFNQELDQYLQMLQSYTFPTPKKTRTIVVYFEAKE